MPTTPELFDIAGQVAVVAGAGCGIGECTATAFAESSAARSLIR